jgi:predicted nucleic-acid-binding protein
VALPSRHEPTVEEALYVWSQHPSADFADCLLLARAAQLGRTRFVTLDAGAAKLPHAELLA